MNLANDIREIIYGDFSTIANYKGNEIKCIFNNETKIFEEGIVIDAVPSAEFVKDDVQGIRSGDTIEIDGTTYIVAEVLETNGGTCKITLTKGNLYD